MANLGMTFNADELPEDQGGDFTPVPAGQYTVKITEAEIQDTKAGTGQFIKMRMDVLAPSHEGRVLFANLNIKNPSQKAEEIGRQQLGSIMRAIGLPTLQDTDQLIGGTVSVKVVVKAAVMEGGAEKYPAGNEIKGYKAVEGGAASMPPASSGASPAAAQAPAQAKPPWAK